MFCCAAFVLGVRRQEFWRGVRARRAMARRGRCRSRCVALVRRNRRRYGGYIVHVGHRRAVRRRRRVLVLPARARRRGCRPGRRARRRLRRHATSSRRARSRRATAPERIVARRRAATCARAASTSRRCARARLLPVARRRRTGPVGRFFDGEADERGRPARRRCGATSGPRSQPDIEPLAAAHRQGDRSSTAPRRRRRAAGDESRRRGDRRRSPHRYVQHPPPAHVPLHRLAAGDVDLDRRR